METPKELAEKLFEMATRKDWSKEFAIEIIELEIRIIKSQALGEYLENRFKENFKVK